MPVGILQTLEELSTDKINTTYWFLKKWVTGTFNLNTKSSILGRKVFAVKGVKQDIYLIFFLNLKMFRLWETTEPNPEETYDMEIIEEIQEVTDDMEIVKQIQEEIHDGDIDEEREEELADIKKVKKPRITNHLSLNIKKIIRNIFKRLFSCD